MTNDAVPLDLVNNDLDIRVLCRVMNFDFTAGIQALVAKWGGAGQRSYYFQINSTSAPRFQWTTDGTTQLSATCSALLTAVPRIGDNAVWLRVTHDIDNGAAGNDTAFWYSFDGVSWTQLGVTSTAGGVTSHFDSSNGLSIGGSGAAGNNTTADNIRIYEAIVKNGINGTTVADFLPNPRDHASVIPVADAFGNSWSGNTPTAFRYSKQERVSVLS